MEIDSSVDGYVRETNVIELGADILSEEIGAGCLSGEESGEGMNGEEGNDELSELHWSREVGKAYCGCEFVNLLVMEKLKGDCDLYVMKWSVRNVPGGVFSLLYCCRELWDVSCSWCY